MPRRVLVVDDSKTVREVLEIVLSLEDDVEVCGVAHNATAAVMMAGELQPDVVILDFEMPGIAGIDALPTILDQAPATVVLMYSARDDLASVQEARDAGAVGYFVKGVDDVQRLVDAVQQQAPTRQEIGRHRRAVGATRSAPAA